MNKVILAICLLFLGYAEGITNQKNETAEAAASETVNRREAPPEFIKPPNGGGIGNVYLPADSYGPPPSGPPTSPGPSGGYGPPKPVYGPPPDVYGPPDIGGPPGDVFAPPPPGDSYLPPSRPSGPKPVYGPPPGPLPGPLPGPQILSISISGLKPPADFYGPPNLGPPPSAYGPPNLRPPKLKPAYGPPKPVYGPPKPSFGNGPPIGGPPKPVYGPPKNTGGIFLKPPSLKPPFGPPKPVYGPPKPVYGPPPKPLKPAFGPPKNNYGPPPRPIYGPPKPKPVYGPPAGQEPHAPPGVPSPPTPPEISYDGWQPIPGISLPPGGHSAPSGSYGPPTGHGPPSNTYGPPSDGHVLTTGFGGGHGSADGGLSLPSANYGPPSDSYGPPDRPQLPSGNYGPPPSLPSSSYGGPPPPLPGDQDHHSGTYDGPPPPLPQSPPVPVKPVYGVPNVGGDISHGDLTPPKTSYGVPSGSYGVPNETPVVPGISYGPPNPPSSPYQPPSGHGSNLEILNSLFTDHDHGSASISSDLTPPGGLYSVSGNNNGPPPTSFGPPPTGNYGPPPSDNYGPPPSDNFGPPPSGGYIPPPITGHGPPSNAYGPPQGNFGFQLSSCCGTPPPDIGGHEHKSNLPLAYGVPSGMQIEGPKLQPKVPIKFRDPVPKGLLEAIGESAEYKTNGHGKPFHGGTYIPPSVPEVPQHHPDDGNNQEHGQDQYHSHGVTDFQVGHPSVDLSPPQLQHLDISNNYGPQLVESHENHQDVGGADLLNSLGLEGTEISKSISHEYTPNAVDIPIQGNQGSYTLNIQSANGESHGSVPHEHVLSNGLLQDILAAIEHQPAAVQQVQPSYDVADAHPSGTEEHSVNTAPSGPDIQRIKHESKEETLVAQESINHDSRAQAVLTGPGAARPDRLDSNPRRDGTSNELGISERTLERHPLGNGFSSSGIALYYNPDPSRNLTSSEYNTTSADVEAFASQRFVTPQPQEVDVKTARTNVNTSPRTGLSVQPEGSYVNFNSPSNKYSYDVTGKNLR